jgi:hypothetical protein
MGNLGKETPRMYLLAHNHPCHLGNLLFVLSSSLGLIAKLSSSKCFVLSSPPSIFSVLEDDPLVFHQIILFLEKGKFHQVVPTSISSGPAICSVESPSFLCCFLASLSCSLSLVLQFGSLPPSINFSKVPCRQSLGRALRQ